MPLTATKVASALPASLEQCIQALDGKKAENLRLLHVGNISSITDYFVIATGTSNPHLKALSEAVVDTLGKEGIPVSVAGAGDQSGWVVVDAYDFMVHIFTSEVRAYFNLEGLWKDGDLIVL